ncbi:glycerophosphodiester phosphodiesterase family protein [Planctomycetota bacterium]
MIAHRGASEEAPENTLAAFRLAWEQEADGIEGDFHLTKDNRIDDSSTKRVAQKDLKIAESTLEDLKKLDVGSWKGAKWAGEEIPTLEEVPATVPLGKKIYIEIKCGSEMIPKLTEVLQAAQVLKEQTIIMSFDEDIVAKSKKALPDRTVLLLVDFEADRATGQMVPNLEDVMMALEATQADGIASNTVSTKMLQAIIQVRKTLHVWTVNDPKIAPALAQAGAASIITDRPGLILKAIREAGK